MLNKTFEAEYTRCGKYTIEEVDSEIKNYYELTDKAFEVFKENRQVIIKFLQERKMTIDNDPRLKEILVQEIIKLNNNK
jgi:DNA-binding PadR family transcriptional regulator